MKFYGEVQIYPVIRVMEEELHLDYQVKSDDGFDFRLSRRQIRKRVKWFNPYTGWIYTKGRDRYLGHVEWFMLCMTAYRMGVKKIKTSLSGKALTKTEYVRLLCDYSAMGKHINMCYLTLVAEDLDWFLTLYDATSDAYYYALDFYRLCREEVRT